MQINSSFIFFALMALIGNASAQAGNLQKFTNCLLNVVAPPVINEGGKFVVTADGKKKTFRKLKDAIFHSCNVQAFQCSQAVMAGKGRKKGVSIGKCKKQLEECQKGQAGAKPQSNQPDPQNAPKEKKVDDKKAPTPPTGLKNDASFCAAVGLGGAISDGTQKKTQTCSVTVQGAIPSFNQMVSTIILSPESGKTIKRGENVKVQVRTNNMDLGFFEDPATRYYKAPQSLNGQGIIEGHQHLSVQFLGNGQTPPDPRTEALTFFKGLNEKADQKGILEVTIPGDSFKTTGEFRLCTITGTRTHQPVIMPVAQRGSQDDCIRVTVA